MCTMVCLVFALMAATAAIADEPAAITRSEQEMVDAVAAGHAAVWDKYLDPK